jgi:hypothetical protein
MKTLLTTAGTLALVATGSLATPDTLEAQGPDGRWPLQPSSRVDRVVAPFMEGWYENEDGTYTISFGYLNVNEDPVEIPLGEDNFIEPAQFDGTQPTYFERGHPRGVFAVTVPASMHDVDVWWTLRNASGEVTRVPGRTSATAYQLDWVPRPHGSLPPSVSFDGQGEEGRGPQGIMAERVLTASVGVPIVLSVNARDPSERDEEDPRSQGVIPVRATWVKHQGPIGGLVEYERHESTPEPEVRSGRRGGFGGRGGGPRPASVSLAEGSGTAQVYATFSEPGAYVMRVLADIFGARDSAMMDQCCWTNAYVRVNVTQ